MLAWQLTIWHRSHNVAKNVVCDIYTRTDSIFLPGDANWTLNWNKRFPVCCLYILCFNASELKRVHCRQVSQRFDCKLCNDQNNSSVKIPCNLMPDILITYWPVKEFTTANSLPTPMGGNEFFLNIHTIDDMQTMWTGRTCATTMHTIFFIFFCLLIICRLARKPSVFLVQLHLICYWTTAHELWCSMIV